jgi:hypothetical protein
MCSSIGAMTIIMTHLLISVYLCIYTSRLSHFRRYYSERVFWKTHIDILIVTIPPLVLTNTVLEEEKTSRLSQFRRKNCFGKRPLIAATALNELLAKLLVAATALKELLAKLLVAATALNEFLGKRRLLKLMTVKLVYGRFRNCSSHFINQ